MLQPPATSWTRPSLLPAADLGTPGAAPIGLATADDACRGVFEHAASGIAIADVHGRLLRVNPAFAAIADAGSTDMLQASLPELAHPDDRAALRAAIARLAGPGPRSVRLEHRLLRTDDRPVWVDTVLAALGERDAAAGEPWLVATVSDVTERRQREEGLAFLAQLSVAFEPHGAPDRIAEVAAQMLAHQLDAACVRLADVDPVAEQATDVAVAASPGRRGGSGPWRLRDAFGDDAVQSLEGGRSITVDDAATGVSTMVAPHLRGGQVRAIIAVQRRRAGGWSSHEQALFREAALRVNARLARARAESALEASEARLQDAAALAGLASFGWDPRRRRLRWDARLRAMWGLAADDPVDPRVLLQGIHPEDRRRVRRAITSALDPAGDGACHAEFRVTGARDRATRWIVARGRTRFGADGRAQSFDAVAQDISAHRAAEAELAERNAVLTAITRNGEALVFAKDTEGRLLFVNDTVARWAGRTAETMVGITEDDYLGPEDARLIRENDRRIMASGQPEVVEESAFGRIFVSTKEPWYDDRGRLCGLVGIAHDVTEQRRAGEALRVSEERLRLAAQAAGFGIHDHDVRTGEVVWSSALCAILGVADGTRRDAASLPDCIHPADREATVAAMRAATEPDADGELAREFRIVRADDGRVRWVTLRARTLFDTDGRTGRRTALRSIGVVIDVTDRKRAEQQLREEARRKDEFLAILAHELRNPLAPIRTAVTVARGVDAAPGPLTRCHDIIDRQATQMSRLLDDLLDISRLAQGKVLLKREPVPLARVIDAAVETARPLIDAHGQTLRLLGDASAIVLDADAARLTQVFANLLNNAAKYGHPGGVIDVDVNPRADAVEVAVRDDGIGIAPDVLDGVFDLFVQSREARRHAPGGLGLGLALAQRLTRLHGGSIRAHSDGPGHGSEFVVHLPLGAPAVAAGAPPTALPGAAGSGRRVLVVDDNADAADTLALLLQGLGCTVRTVYDGESAVREAVAFDPELVLLDLGMSGIDGFETCRRLRAIEGGENRLVVAVSGWGQDEDRRRSAIAGFDKHLVKPVEVSVLLELLRETPEMRRA